MNSYLRPPIVEAVVEFLTNSPISFDDLQAMSNKVAGDYKNQTIEKGIEVRIDTLGGAATIHSDQTPDRFRRTSDDQADIVIFADTSLIVARAAPYPGWDVLSERIRKNWRIWSKGQSGRGVVRLGARFINRIDIPINGEERIELSDYLNLLPQIPNISDKPMSTFLVQASMPTANPHWDCNIMSTIVAPSPLLNHMSILLDIDVFRMRDIPSKSADVLAILEEARPLKNTIFERCITDRARDLFR
ncbi:TIGR04255 family protein [Mesorhizobium kowhaii]|uniref:TIGR04255 family protein n=1 Tax=Mesorhizobium kowhaii TaxID=1300272 RepID=UPI00142E27E1|nr:TIGR04255 family protein [Mesorhizobium kowhaii]